MMIKGDIKMKIDPKHDYKKPLYAIGVATLIGATALFGTACGPKDSTGRTKSNIDSKPSESEIELAGEETRFLPFNQGSAGAGEDGGAGNPGWRPEAAASGTGQEVA